MHAKTDKDKALGYPQDIEKWPKVLTFDTSGPFISIGWTHQSRSGGEVHDMARGQAEALFPLLEQALNALNWTWQDVDALGVGVGPGNFTGIRISVSAARGLAMSLGIPVFPVSNFENCAGHVSIPSGTVTSIPAPRDQAYIQVFGPNNGPLLGDGRLIDPSDPPSDVLRVGGQIIRGHRADDVAKSLGITGHDQTPTPNPALMAEITREKYLSADAFPDRPAPLYIKAADAAPPRDPAPKILS